VTGKKISKQHAVMVKKINKNYQHDRVMGRKMNNKQQKLQQQQHLLSTKNLIRELKCNLGRKDFWCALCFYWQILGVNARGPAKSQKLFPGASCHFLVSFVGVNVLGFFIANEHSSFLIRLAHHFVAASAASSPIPPLKS
jgi:hypothetical protein